MQWLNSGEQMKLIDAEQVRELMDEWAYGRVDFDELMRRCAALPGATPQWQPMAMAPKEGTTIMLLRRLPRSPIGGYWDDGEMAGKRPAWTLIGTGGLVNGYIDEDFIGWSSVPPLPPAPEQP